MHCFLSLIYNRHGNNSSKAHHINFVYCKNSSLIFHHLSILKGDLLTVDCLRASSSALVDELCGSCSVFKNLKSVDPVCLFFFTEDLSSTIDRTSAPENSPLENSFLALAVIKHPWDPANANSHFGIGWHILLDHLCFTVFSYPSANLGFSLRFGQVALVSTCSCGPPTWTSCQRS